jgi:hypothetical protein
MTRHCHCQEVMCASIQDPGGGGVGVAGAVQPLKELFMASHISCTSSGGCCSQGGRGAGGGCLRMLTCARGVS